MVGRHTAMGGNVGIRHRPPWPRGELPFFRWVSPIRSREGFMAVALAQGLERQRGVETELSGLDELRDIGTGRHSGGRSRIEMLKKKCILQK